MKRLFWCLLLTFILNITTSCSQPKGVSGVYAGIQIMTGVTMGGGMTRSDEALLLRADGTYNDDLSKADWKTRVSGHYTVNGNQLSLRDTRDNKVSTYQFDKDGDISMGSYNLVKQPVSNSVPKGQFEFSSIAGSGGGSSGATYVGTGSNKNLYFDGNGNFWRNSSSATAVIGGNVGGGSSKKSSGDGTYTINQGLLTLKYSNGRTELHSFFCRPGYEPIMAVIDGNVYFMKKNSQGLTTGGSSSAKSSASTSSGASKSSNTGSGRDITDGKALLRKANAVHGGTTLDAITTVQFTATMQGIQIASYMNLAANRIRMEARQGGKLVQVEQMEGQTGWQWRQGQISALPANRVSEMRSAFYSGLLGLRQSQINAATIKDVKQVTNGYTVVCEQNGKRYAFFLNTEGKMIASADQSGQAANTSAYSNFRTIHGVLIPFNEVQSSGNQKVTIQYQSFSMNTPIADAVWKKP